MADDTPKPHGTRDDLAKQARRLDVLPEDGEGTGKDGYVTKQDLADAIVAKQTPDDLSIQAEVDNDPGPDTSRDEVLAALPPLNSVAEDRGSFRANDEMIITTPEEE